VAAPRTSLTENIDLTFDILEEYLASEEILDDEIVRKIKQGFYNQVNAKKAELLGHLRSGVLAPDMVEVEDDEGDFIK
jgi:hypothetical protein